MKMQGGSDLMTPGLAGPPFPQKAKKGSVVAVAGLSKPSVPIVVGNCEIDISSLENVQGVKGHAVRGVHWSGDELWSWSANGQPGIPPPDEISGWMDEAQNQDAAAKAMEDLDLEDNDEQGGVALHPDASAQPPETLHEGDLPMPNKTETAETSLAVKGMLLEIREVLERFVLIPLEIDDIFRKAFTYGIYQAKINNKDDPKHGITFPISQSSVVSNFISPYLPITSPSQAAQLQIKRTSWKSVTKFIKALDKEKILKSKDRNGGETVILDIDFDGRQILDFKPYKLPSKDTTGAESGGGGGGKAASAGRSGDSSLGQSLKLLNLYRPKPSLNQIFEIADASTKDLYTPTELRNVIMSYVDKERLADKRFVKLDPIIANAVFDGSTSLDQEILAKGTVPRDALVYRIQHSCSPFWILLRNEETRDKVKAKSGHGPKIHIVLETRSGNKTVTKVSGVEAFYIAPQVLASELQRTCASSTSVDQLVGSSPKNPVQEIMVQGPQQDAVIKALEDRGVRRQWVEVNNKTKGKKKTAG